MFDMIWAVPLLLFVLYLGQVAGLAMQSHRIRELKYVRGYELYIPLLAFELLIHLLFDLKNENRWRYLYVYLFKIKNQSLMIAMIVSNTIQEYSAAHPIAQVAYEKKRIKHIGQCVNLKGKESIANLVFDF